MRAGEDSVSAGTRCGPQKMGFR